MAYIGNIPAEQFTSVDIQNFSVSATANYTLDRPVANENEIELFINNVRQHPGSGKAYTASGTALTLSEATAGSDTMYCVYQGKARQTVTPATSSVTNAMLAGSIALDKLSATGTKSSSTFLRGDNTFASAGLSNWSESSGNLLPSNASYGVYLGVNSATAANLLNDYEFGTFTPDADPTSGSFTTKGTMSGFYTKVGNLVHYQIEISITNSGGASANIEVYNLPFTTASSGLVHTVNHGRETQVNGSTFPTIQSVNTTTLVMLGPPFGNGAGYSLNGTYRV